MNREVNVINFNEGTLNINVEGNVKVSKAYSEKENITVVQLEKTKEYIPQFGDIIHLGEAYPFIDERLGIFNKCDRDYYGTIFSIFLNTNKVEYDNWSANERPIRLATEEECEVVFKKLKELGKKWNPDTKKIEDIYIPKDGDVIYVKLKNDTEYICIFKVIEGTMLRTYCDKSLPDGTVWTFAPEACFLSHIDHIKDMRIATEEQKKILFDGLASRDKYWNKEEKVLEDIPKVGDLCIFWDGTINRAIISTLKELRWDEVYPYLAGNGIMYTNCIKYTSKEQYLNLIKLRQK